MYSVFSIIIYAVLLELAFLWAIEHFISKKKKLCVPAARQRQDRELCPDRTEQLNNGYVGLDYSG